MLLHREHITAMQATMLFDALDESCLMATQDFLVMVCLPKHVKY